MAKFSDMSQKHGAVVASGGKILASGFNNISPCYIASGCSFLHAEISACLQVPAVRKRKSCKLCVQQA